MMFMIFVRTENIFISDARLGFLGLIADVIIVIMTRQ